MTDQVFVSHTSDMERFPDGRSFVQAELPRRRCSPRWPGRRLRTWPTSCSGTILREQIHRAARLAMRMRGLRSGLELTVEEVPGRLPCSATKISRIETGAPRVSRRDVRDLCLLYGVGEQSTAELMDLVRQVCEQAHQVKFMIHDRGSNFTTAPSSRSWRTPESGLLCNVQTRMNAISECWIGGCLRELLDRTPRVEQQHLPGGFPEERRERRPIKTTIGVVQPLPGLKHVCPVRMGCPAR